MRRIATYNRLIDYIVFTRLRMVCMYLYASVWVYVYLCECTSVRIRVDEAGRLVDGDAAGCLHDELWYFVPENVCSFRSRSRRQNYAREIYVYVDMYTCTRERRSSSRS